MSAVPCRVLCEIPNRKIAGGVPFLLLRAEDGKYARGVTIGDETHVLGEWIDPQKALEGATRVLGEDAKAITHPTALMALALTLIGLLLEGQELSQKGAEAEK